MSSTSAIFSALPVLLFAFFGLVASIVLFIHIIRRRMQQSSEIDVEASAEATTTEVPLLVNAFKEDDAITTSLPTRPSQHFKTGLVVEHTFASTIPEHDPMPIVKVVRYTPLKQSEAGSWDLNTRTPNVTLSTVQSEKHVVIEQHDLEYAAQSCIVEEWVSSSPVESPDASLPNSSHSSLPTQKSRTASATPSPSSTPRASKKTAASTVTTNTTPSAAIPALWRSSIQKSTSSTTTMAKTPRSGTKPRSSKVATITTQSSPDKSLSSSSSPSSKSAASPPRSKSTVTVSRKTRVSTRKNLDMENKENMKVEGEGRRKVRAPLAVVNRWV